MEILLYILVPDEDFRCKPLRFILRDIFSNGVILPLFDLITDPDYINQVIIWIVSITTLRLTESTEELRCTKELVQSEMHNLVSKIYPPLQMQ